MNDKYSYLFKNIGILTVSNFSSKILVFLLVPLYTSVLTIEEYGIYDIVISTVQIVFPILTLNIVDATMRFLLDRGYSKKEIISISYVYILRSFFLVGFILILNSQIKFIPIIENINLLVFLYYVTFVLNQYFIQICKGLEKFWDLGIASLLSTIVMLIANIVFLIVFKWTLFGFFLATILSQCVASIYYIFRLRYNKYLIKVNNQELKEEMIRYSVPLIFTIIGWWINATSSRYIVTYICGIGANGILSIAYKIPSIINVCQNIFLQAWQVSAIKNYEKNSQCFYDNVFIYYNFTMCIVCSILIILSKILATILYAKDFYIAWQYVPFLLISIVINSMAGFIGSILAAIKNTNIMAKSAIYGAISNIIFSIIFIYFWGIQGATIATCMSSYIIYLIRTKCIKDYINDKSFHRIYLTWSLLILQAIIEIYSSYWFIELIIMMSIILLHRNVIKLKIKGRCIR